MYLKTTGILRLSEHLLETAISLSKTELTYDFSYQTDIKTQQ